MKKKLFTAVALTLSAMVLVVASVLGTIAYLTASSAVSNTFTVGNVAIHMWETQVNKNGEILNPTNPVKVQTNSYHLVPGGRYVKDPTIEIQSTLDGDSMFLYVKSRNGIRNIEEGNHTSPVQNAALSMRQQMEANGWVQLVTSGDGKDIVWVYGTRATSGKITPLAVNADYQQKRLDNSTGPKGQIQLCQFFKVDNRFTDLSEHNSSMVDFVAFAIQSSGFDTSAGDIAKNAWDAIKTAHENATAILNPMNPYDATKGPYEAVPVSTQSGV